MRQFTEDRRRLKELILYISQESASDPDYGWTALNKILFFSDFLAYAKFGKPITGTEYMREKHGPVPRPLRAGKQSPVQELTRAGDLRLDAKPLKEQLPRPMTRVTPVALRTPDLSMFSAEEIDLVKSVVDGFRGWTAGAISKYTHQFVLWQSVALNQTIPYETIFVSPDQRLTDNDIKRGQELAREHGWLTGKS